MDYGAKESLKAGWMILFLYGVFIGSTITQVAVFVDSYVLKISIIVLIIASSCFVLNDLVTKKLELFFKLYLKDFKS